MARTDDWNQKLVRGTAWQWACVEIIEGIRRMKMELQGISLSFQASKPDSSIKFEVNSDLERPCVARLNPILGLKPWSH